MIYACFSVNPKLVSPAPILLDSLVELLAVELLSDRVIAMATDTVFGLIGRAASCHALDLIASIKGRDPSVSMPVIIGDRAQLDSMVPKTVLGEAAVSGLFDKFWPGPLTVVLPLLSGAICDRFFSSGTVGIRLPDDLRLQAVARRVGPLVATSANEHGKVTLRSGREVMNDLVETGVGATLSVVLDEQSRSEFASTIVEVAGRNFRLIREGAISGDAIATAFRISGQEQ